MATAPVRKPGEALAQALRARGCDFSVEDAARLAVVLVSLAADGLLLSPAQCPDSPRSRTGLPVRDSRERGARGIDRLPGASNTGQSVCMGGDSDE